MFTTATWHTVRFCQLHNSDVNIRSSGKEKPRVFFLNKIIEILHTINECDQTF